MRPQLISIPFSASVDESINAKIAPKGVFQKLENVYYTKSGQLVRRNGYDQIMQMGSSALYCGYRIGSNGDTKVQIRDTLGDNAVGGIATINLSSSATDIGRADDWERLGWLGAAGAIETRQAHARAEAEVLQCGVAQANGYLIYAWIDLSASTGQFRWRVENAAGVEIDSGALNYPTNPYGSGYLRIFRWGDKLCVGCFDTAQQRIEIFWWDTSNGQSNTWIVPTFDDVDAPPWDVVWDSIEDRLHIVHAVFFGENPDGTVLRKFRDDGGNNFTQTMYKTYATTATSGATLALNGDHSRLLVFWAGFDLWCASLSTAGYTYNSGVLTVDTANERTSLVCAPINDYSWICLSSAHVTSSGGIETETVLQSRVWSINASTMVETYQTLYGVRAASKFFARQASDYGYHHLIWMMYDCNNGPPWDDPDLLWDGAPTGQQRQWLLYQYRYDGSGAGLEDFELVGRAAYRTATGRMADIDQCTHVADLETSDGRWQWAAPEVFTGDVRLHEFTGVGTYTVTLSVWDRCQFADHGGLCISSSLPTYVGTRNLSEIGFLIAPDQLAEDHASGSSIPAGVYQYKMTYEAVDEDGQLHRSAASLALQVELSAAADIELTWPLLNLTRRGEVMTKIWRTKDAGELFYLAHTEPDSDAGETATWTDTLTDDELGNEIIYVDSGEQADFHPPSCDVILAHGRRLWVANGRRLYYSKWYREGFAPRFVETWYLTLPHTITALATQDDVLIVFGENSVWSIWGTGPDDLGAGEFNPPQHMPGEFGCPRALGGQRSVVATELGILFRSQRGIALLPRGLGAPQIISDPIRDTLDVSTITAACNVLGEQQQVRFSTGVGGANHILVWDYTRGLPGIWTSETGALHAGINSLVLWDGKATILNTTADAIYQQTDYHADDGADLTSIIETSSLRLAELGGEMRVYSSTLEADVIDGDRNIDTTALTSWSLYNMGGVTGGQDDPDGGSDAYWVYENSNPVSATHSIYFWTSFTEDRWTRYSFSAKRDTTGYIYYLWVTVGSDEVRINLVDGSYTSISGDMRVNIREHNLGSDDGWWAVECETEMAALNLGFSTSITTSKSHASDGDGVFIYGSTAVQNELIIETSTDDGETYPENSLRMYDCKIDTDGPFGYENPVQRCDSIRYRITDIAATDGLRYTGLTVYAAARQRARPRRRA